MQENRAFDHYFGSLKGVRGFNDRITIPLKSGLNSFHQPIDQEDLSQYMLPFHVDSHSTSAMCMDAPLMNYECDMKIFNNGRFDQWNTARNPGTGMSYFNREDLPYYYTLYDNFAMGDQYYQSSFTATNPNRMFFFTGSNGLSVSDTSSIGNEGGDDHQDVDDYIGHDTCVLDNQEPRPGFNWTTMGEVLEENKITWKGIYLYI
jgi:phospholipase C